MTKPWAEPGLSVEERAKRLAGALIVSSRLDLYHPHITEALRQARADALEEAAKALEGAFFLFTIQRPGTGPFTRQDITTREVVEQGAAAIRALKENHRG